MARTAPSGCCWLAGRTGSVRAAIAGLALGNKQVVEGSGAMSVALGERRDGPVVCILTGGSMGADRLAEKLTARSG